MPEMTTAQYITITIITIYAYFVGLKAQIEQRQVYGYEEYIDFFYPITTGFWLMIHAFYTGLALLLEIFGMNGNKIYGKMFFPYTRCLDTVPHLTELFFGCLTSLLYYPFTFIIIYIYGDFNIWLASPIAFVALCLINQLYGYINVGYNKDAR